MEYKKDVTPAQFNEFFELFNKRHLDIDMRLPTIRSLVNGGIYCNQPAKMPDDEYDIYFRFLKRWYMDNDFMPFEPDMVIVATNNEIDKTVVGIDTANIKDIKAVTMDLTDVTFERDSQMLTVTIKEKSDYFKKRAYIF